MGRRRQTTLMGVLVCAGLLVAACGDDDDGGTAEPAETTAGGETETTAGSETTAGAETTAGEEEEPEATDAEATTPEGSEAEPGGGAAGGDEGESARGAEELRAALEATADEPLAADDSLDPFVVGVVNIEGDPAGSFPEVTEGAEAAAQLINERLGGIGADVEAGTPGRPVELVVCRHGCRPERGSGLRQRARRRQPQRHRPRDRLLHPVDVPDLRRRSRSSRCSRSSLPTSTSPGCTRRSEAARPRSRRARR